MNQRVPATSFESSSISSKTQVNEKYTGEKFSI